MNNILLTRTDNSPKVIMDKDKRVIEFEGKTLTLKILLHFTDPLQNG